MKAISLDRERLCEIYEYDSELGLLRDKRTQTLMNGKPAYGYIQADNGCGKRVAIHRIIWTIINGDIEEGMVIDHIDRDKCNNKIENLRCVTQSENNRNRCCTYAAPVTEDEPVITRAEPQVSVEDAELMETYLLLTAV
ncbi:HNH endonuclease [Synechococcus sp. AH-601-B19]|nr:HNH endonuclease [Synechococcus sp. AH-601-B19]